MTVRCFLARCCGAKRRRLRISRSSSRAFAVRGSRERFFVFAGKAGVVLRLTLEVTGHGADHEQRLWNDNNIHLRHVPVRRETGDMVFSVVHPERHGQYRGQKDIRPGWVPGIDTGQIRSTPLALGAGERERKSFAQSARHQGATRGGSFLKLGPFSLQRVDSRVRGEMTTVMEDPKFDYLAPQMLADGRVLYFVARISHSRAASSAHDSLKFSRCCFPFRLLYVFFQIYEFILGGFLP